MAAASPRDFWTKAKSLYLIDLYGRHSYLWDSTHRLYRSKQKRAEGYRAVAEAVGASVEEVKRKLDCLLAQYRREKIRAGQVEAGEREYKDAWWGLLPLGFLDDQYYRKRPAAHVKLEDASDADAGEFAADDAAPHAPAARQASSRRAARRRLLLRRRDPAKIVRVYDRAEGAPAAEPRRDEFGAYAETVADRLRALAGRKARLVAMNQIDNLLFSAQMEELDAASDLMAFLPSADDAGAFEQVCEQTLDHRDPAELDRDGHRLL